MNVDSRLRNEAACNSSESFSSQSCVERISWSRVTRWMFIFVALTAPAVVADGPALTRSTAVESAVPHNSVRTRPATEAVPIHFGPHLFIDEYLIAESQGVHRITQLPKRFLDGPILGRRQHMTTPYVTVIKDPNSNLFRMWYNYDIGPNCSVAYAESQNGIRWQTPSLNILGADNRLLRISTDFQNAYGASVVDDGLDARDQQRRYKLTWWGQEKPWAEPADKLKEGGDPGMRVAFSRDGLHWTKSDQNPVLPDFSASWLINHPERAFSAGDIIDAYWDPIRRRYGVFLKSPALPADNFTTGARADHHFRRLVTQSASIDFVRWKRPWRVMVPEARDDGQLEFYGVGGALARGSLLIAFVRMLHDDYAPEPDGATAGIGYSTLATSRDGEHWERHDDIFFDRNPRPHTWDRAMSWIGSAVPVGDELYLYYGGYEHGHKSDPTRERQLGLVKMPRDRFVARQASGDAPGRLLTTPLAVGEMSEGDLVLNAAAAQGRIRVQVRDLQGAVRPGFAFDECLPITGDGLELPVVWQSQKDQADGGARTTLTRLAGSKFRLELELTNASVYGFDVERPYSSKSNP